MGEYQRSYLKGGESVVFSMDGKTLRGTIPAGEVRGMHLLSVFVPEQGLVLVQAAVDRKENEIVVAPTILKQVNLSGVIVLADAMHTQRETSSQIVKAGGDYVWPAACSMLSRKRRSISLSQPILRLCESRVKNIGRESAVCSILW